MMMEDDTFYQTLPFTISQEQATSQYIILGTGLQECLIAAHLSKLHGKLGLILDQEKTYGSCLKTLTFKELHQLTNKMCQERLYNFIQIQKYRQMNQSFHDELMEGKAFRGYNIDIEPNFFLGASVTCQMLKDAEMDKYMDFRLVNNMVHFDGKSLKNVPLSKGKIFESKDLGLLQKKLLLNTFHSLMQIYNKYMKIEEDQNSTKEFDKEFGNVNEALYEEFLQQLDQPFTPFIKKLTKDNKKIMNYITYIICNYQHNFMKEIPSHMQLEYTVKGFIKRFGKFVRSCGVYGELPYLYVDNGIGDIPQAYSRIASIYGSTYILHPKITFDKIEITQNEENNVSISSNLYPDGKITAKKIFYGPTFYDIKNIAEEHYDKQDYLRCILILKKTTEEFDCPALAHLLDIEGFENPIYLFMLDNESHTCPKDYIVYQFQTIIQGQTQQKIEEQVEIIMDIMKKIKGDQLGEILKYCSVYVREKRYPKEQKSYEGNEIFLVDHKGIDLDSHFTNFIKVVGEKEKYFKKEKQGGQEDEFGQGNETIGLIERLDQLDLNTQEVEQKVEENQEKEQVQEQQEQKQEQKDDQNEIKGEEDKKEVKKDQNQEKGQEEKVQEQT